MGLNNLIKHLIYKKTFKNHFKSKALKNQPFSYLLCRYQLKGKVPRDFVVNIFKNHTYLA